MSDTIRIKDYLKEKKLICDGALGTYFKELYNSEELPELCNIKDEEKIKRIHLNYISAGAKLVRTNTFASNTLSLDTSLENVLINVHKACDIAAFCASSTDEKIFVAGDIGPIPYENISLCENAAEEYIAIAKEMLSCQVDCIIFETFSQLTDILPALKYIKEVSDTFTIVNFTVNQFGYSSHGISLKKLLSDASANPHIDALGLNCGIGPSHMKSVIEDLSLSVTKPFCVFPNAGYPEMLGNRMNFVSNNSNYFSDVLSDISLMGVSILGGCCGTSPEYIKRISERINIYDVRPFYTSTKVFDTIAAHNDNCFISKQTNNRKLIGVELFPPFDINT